MSLSLRLLRWLTSANAWNASHSETLCRSTMMPIATPMVRAVRKTISM
jgi:hypothetical protein